MKPAIMPIIVIPPTKCSSLLPELSGADSLRSRLLASSRMRLVD